MLVNIALQWPSRMHFSRFSLCFNLLKYFVAHNFKAVFPSSEKIPGACRTSLLVCVNWISTVKIEVIQAGSFSCIVL